VILNPQNLAGVLSQVITASDDKVKNCKGGFLRHDELSKVWGEYDSSLHKGFLALIHGSNLGFPLNLENDSMKATLIPAMLPTSDNEAMSIYLQVSE